MPVFEGSRYTKATAYSVLEDDGRVVTVIGHRKDYIPPHPSDMTYRFKQGDRLDLIAHQFYGDPQLYWVILDANPQYASELDIQPGDFLTIPAYYRIAGR